MWAVNCCLKGENVAAYLIGNGPMTDERELYLRAMIIQQKNKTKIIIKYTANRYTIQGTKIRGLAAFEGFIRGYYRN
jgi:hypothetical protein